MAKRRKSARPKKSNSAEKKRASALDLADRLDWVAIELTTVSNAILGCDFDKRHQAGLCRLLDRQIDEVRAIGEVVGVGR